MPRHPSKTIKTKITVDGLEVWVLQKRRVRNMCIRVQPDGRVEVSTPMKCPIDLVENFVRKQKDWIARAQRSYQQSPMGRMATASKEELDEYRRLVQALTPALVEKWAPEVGVDPQDITLAYRKMKSRWGSCQPKTGRICINIALALYPIKSLEYVVVHELCHMLVAGHGSEFQAQMDRLMPDWRERRAKLR